MKADCRNRVPRARQEQLIVKELPDELLMLRSQSDKAHCLNETAALVWKNCDGHKTVDQLRELMEENAGSPVSEEMVWLALDQLETFRLLERNSAKAGAVCRYEQTRYGQASRNCSNCVACYSVDRFSDRSSAGVGPTAGSLLYRPRTMRLGRL